MMTRELQHGMYIAKRRRDGWKRVFPFRYFTNRALLLFLILFLLSVSLFFAIQAMAAEIHEPRQKTVVCIQIRPGDTLWSIAKDYYSDDFGNMTEYITEIKRSNRLKDDMIHPGAYLIVPYYTSSVNHKFELLLHVKKNPKKIYDAGVFCVDETGLQYRRFPV